MSPIVIAVLSVAGIGILCAIMLAVFSKVMAVPVDEKYVKVRECLPGANCGACGYAGCDGYAKALSDGDEERTNLCVPGADAVSRQLSDVLGVAFQDVVEQVAVVKCRGDCNAVQNKMNYEGIKTCAAANMLFAGFSACSCGCLGLGDCAAACPEHAICMDNGLAHVDTRKCVGCGVCVKTCPNHLIDLMADVEKVLVKCSSTDSTIVTRSACSRGCLGCGKCQRECPAGAITVVNNLAHVDYEKCTNCGHCAEVCLTGAIHFGSYLGAHKVSAE